MLTPDGKLYHIHCKPGDVGRYVLLPGDPFRTDLIASYFDDARLVAHNREHKTWTGTLNGVKVSVTSTGMGCPSAAIAVEELIKCGADTFIRVGTAGRVCDKAYDETLDGVINTAAVRDEGTTIHYIPIEYPAVADRHVVDALARAAKKLGYNFAEGITQSKDSFYGQHEPEAMPAEGRLKERWEAWRRGNVMSSEMESAAIFVISSIRGCRASSIMAYTDMRKTVEVACEALRTVTINTTQAWCGNRFGKGLIRPFGTNHPLTDTTIDLVRRNIADVRRRYDEVRHDIKSSPSLLSRFEQCGIVPRSEMTRIGGVGPAARASGVGRDLRSSHPWGVYGGEILHEPFVKQQGDVMARLMMRCRETLQSADYVLRLLDACDPATPLPSPDYAPAARPDALAFGLVEGWRGEICHVALTDAQGALRGYKIKDPSLHNWLALALAVRGEGISDFPICNKSFNLSYCGHDL